MVGLGLQENGEADVGRAWDHPGAREDECALGVTGASAGERGPRDVPARRYAGNVTRDGSMDGPVDCPV